MGNDALWVSFVDVCRGSLVRAQVGMRRGTETILLHVLMSHLLIDDPITQVWMLEVSTEDPIMIYAEVSLYSISFDFA
jgi:hypothetical protein